MAAGDGPPGWGTLIVRPWWDEHGCLCWRVWHRLTGNPVGEPWPDLDGACRHAARMIGLAASWMARPAVTQRAFVSVRREVTDLEAHTWEHPSITYVADSYPDLAG